MNNRDRGENLDFSYLPDINIEVPELNKPISEAINSLKRGKSPGFDGVLSDFLLMRKNL